MSSSVLTGQWQALLGQEFEKPYMKELKLFLQEQQTSAKKVYPASQQVFRAFTETPFEKVKVVILGQDPYHGPGQAEGLSFSVPQGINKPPSLLNILKEMQSDIGLQMPEHGSLVSWAKQGVLLLNSVLTVENGQAASHQNQGWEQFTDAVIESLNAHKTKVAFVLWGSYAIKKGKMIDRDKHLVIESVHPSPLSAYRGFFGSKPFSRINCYLSQHALGTINWSLT